MPSIVTRELTLAREGGTKIRQCPVAASQTIVKGDIVIISDGSGLVTQAANPGANIAAAGANVRLAVAGQTSVNAAAGTKIAIEIVDEGTRLRMPLCADDLAQVWATAQRNKQFEIRRRSSTGEYVVNVSASTNPKVEVLEPDELTQGDAAPFVWVKPLLSNGSWAR